jgi:6-phosphofructokinase 1
MGAAAIDALMEDQRNVMIGIKNDEIVYVPFSKAIKNDKPIDRELLNTLRADPILRVLPGEESPPPGRPRSR